jgi:hypothetical protein
MNPVVEIWPDPNNGGFILRYGTFQLWYAQEIHAINYAQDLCSHCDVVVYDTHGRIKHRYSAIAGRLRTDLKRATYS